MPSINKTKVASSGIWRPLVIKRKTRRNVSSSAVTTSSAKTGHTAVGRAQAAEVAGYSEERFLTAPAPVREAAVTFRCVP
jgi:hypothetical protein